MKHEGQCRLCLRHAELRDSHLIPKSVYKLLRNEAFTNPNPYILGRESGGQKSTQIRQYLLCQDCEQRFSARGESWVIANCWRGEGRFPIQEVLEQSTPIIANDELK